MSDPPDVEVAATPSSFTIYVPDFLEGALAATGDLKALSRQLREKNWLTTGLVGEIEALLPSDDEIDLDNGNKRDLEAFKRKAAQLFPQGRVFASFKQLDQASKVFLEAWAISKVHTQKKILCSYSQTLKKRDTHPDVAKRRRTQMSPKDVYKCPFELRYSFIKYDKSESKKPDIFYRVKITSATYEHTCELNTIFMRVAKQRSGELQRTRTNLIDELSDIPNLSKARLPIVPDQAVSIRQISTSDWVSVWPILKDIFRAGETFPFSPDIIESDAQHEWCEKPMATYVATDDHDNLLGTYYLQANQPGLGGHVCNSGYIVAPKARGQGIATKLCVHSLDQAKQLGFRAMQLNMIVSTNSAAVHICQKLGFAKVGTLPGAFNHKRVGYVDTFVMFKHI